MSDGSQPGGATGRAVRPGAAAPQWTEAEQVADSQARLQAILQTAIEGIITIDEEGLIESMNPAAEAMFGWGVQELKGKSVTQLMPSPWAEQHDAYLRNYLLTGSAKVIGVGREVRGLRKDGSEFPMDLSVSEVRLTNRRIFTGFARDISVRKESEAKLEDLTRSLLERNQELETILYVASHDLRSPLVNIQGFSKELSLACEQLRTMLASRVLPETSQLGQIVDGDIPEALEFIRAGVCKMDSILSGLLLFSRLGRSVLAVRRLDMNLLMQTVARAMEFQIQRSGARVMVEPLPTCCADETHTSQVFSNLLDNAVKYLDRSRSGEISITGEIRGDQSVYAVRDNGIGIAVEHQAKVFAIFHRLNPSFAPGEGLGLAIAQRLVERQGGRIWVESALGQGSAFFVSLPRTQSAKQG